MCLRVEGGGGSDLGVPDGLRVVGVEGQAHVLQVLVAGLVVVPRVPDAFTGGGGHKYVTQLHPFIQDS